jgi:hypothetical protein
MATDKKTPRIVDCPSPKCDGKVDLEADETTCSKCGVDVGNIARKYAHDQAYENYRKREEEKNKPAPKKREGFGW